MLILVDNNNKIVKYPYTIDDLKKDNPSTTFPAFINDDTLNEFGVYRANGNPPEHDPYIKIEESDPVFKNGIWNRVFKTRNATDEEVQELYDIEANKVKSRRNDLLKECDWTQIADADLTDKEKSEWKKYRQSLRDISISKGYPWKVTWPKIPNISSKVQQDSPEL